MALRMHDVVQARLLASLALVHVRYAGVLVLATGRCGLVAMHSSTRRRGGPATLQYEAQFVHGAQRSESVDDIVVSEVV